MCNRFLAIVFLLIMSNSILLAHDGPHHQYIVREAFKLLKKSYPTQLNDMENYIGNNEIWSGSSADGSFGALKIVSGVCLEDEYDVVYGYGILKKPQYHQTIPLSILVEVYDDWTENDISRKAYTTITHFWDADNGENAPTTLSDKFRIGNDNIYWSFTIPENAMQKMRKYINGAYDFIWAYNNKKISWSWCFPNSIHLMTKFNIPALIDFYNSRESFSAFSYRAEDSFWYNTDCPTWNTSFSLFHKAHAYEILGRMCHLLGDMSVPAHVHCTAHGAKFEGDRGMRFDEYEHQCFNQEGPYFHQWTADEIWNQGGKFINPFIHNDPVFFLMYLMNQIADHFADSRINGDDNYNSNLSILSEIMSNLPPSPSSSSLDPNLSNSATTIRNAVNIIHQALQPYAIKATAGLLYWFAVETGQLPRPEIWSGTITQNTTWSGTICLNGSVIVNNNSILTIEPGTTIEFWGPYTITVNSGAKVIAQGSSSQPIRFTSATGTTPGSWKYVQLQGGNSIFKYCIFEYGWYPLYLYYATSGNPTLIENCTFKDNSHYGLRLYHSNAKVKSCEMKSNGYYGVHCYNNPDVKFTGNWIHHNSQYGIYSLSNNFLEFYGNVIENNGSNGLYTSNIDHIHIGEPYKWYGYNTIRNNGGDEVYASSGNPHVEMNYSSIHHNTGLEVYNYPGNPQIYTQNCYWDVNGCQYSGDVYLQSPQNSLPSWDGQRFTNGPFGKALEPLIGGNPDWIVDPSLPDVEKIRLYKEIISKNPLSDKAETALVWLYSIVRSDYVEDKLKEKDKFYDFLEGIYNSQKDQKIGKMALRYMILWKMLDQDFEKFVKLSHVGLKELDGVDRMYVLTDLGFGYTHRGNLAEAGHCLRELKQKYSDREELIRLFEEDVSDVKYQMKKGLFKPPESFEPYGESEPSVSSGSVAVLDNYPNPGNPSTTLCFHLSESRNVSLKVFNLLGQEVRELVNGKKEAGTYSIVWDGKDNRNMEMASGVYVFVLKLDDKIISKKFTLIR